MSERNFKNRRSLVLELVFLAALIAATFAWLLRDCDTRAIFAAIREADLRLIGLGLLCMFLYLLCGGNSAGVLMRAMGARMGSLRCLRYHMIEFFFSAITPSSTGGQPVEILAMRAEGYRAAEATAALLMVATLYKVALLVLFALLYATNFAFLHAQVRAMWFLFALGLLLNLITITVLVMGLYAQRTMRRLCDGILRLLGHMRVVRHPDAARKKLADWLEGFHGCARLMREHPLPVFKSFALVLLQRVLYLLIPWCVYVALGLHGASVWQLMGLQLLLSTSVEMLPLPGAVGASESGFLVLYNAVFGAQALYPAVMLSRGISYYLPLLVSAGVVVFTRLSYLRAHRRIPSA